MAYSAALISLGCAKNLVNSEQMIYLLTEAGYKIVQDVQDSDIAIVNTCGFIDTAKSEAISVILELSQLKRDGIISKIIVAGCLTQRYQDEIADEFPEVDAFVGVGSFGEIVSAADGAISGSRPRLFGDINGPLDETGRAVSTGSGWAYLKIADGCDNHCSFCIIPALRGRYRSRPFEKILEEAKVLAESGTRELIIIAQDITRYGVDLYGRYRLSELILELCKIPGIQLLRLHYLYPDIFDDELISVIAAQPKVAKYLDIPIQHINSRILKRMNRRGSGDDIRMLFKKLRERIDGLVLRTSLIAGLPGESDEDFEELCSFLRESRIELAGVFPYSPEEGTPAARMPDIPNEDTALRRAELICDIQSEIYDRYIEGRVGHEYDVICEGIDPETGLWFGRSYGESPDIDGRILFYGDAQIGEFVRVCIVNISDGEMTGEVVNP